MILDLLPGERSRHASVAIAVTVFACLILLFKPLDFAIWATQAKLIDREASGEIVLVEFGSDSYTDAAARNRSLTNAIRTLQANGADRIVVNVPLTRSHRLEQDRELRDLLQSNSQQVQVAYPGTSESAQAGSEPPADEFFVRGLETLDSGVDPDFLGFVWGFPARTADQRRSMAFGLTEYGGIRGHVAIDGTIAPESVPHLTIKDIRASRDTGVARGKSIVIGDNYGKADVRLVKAGYNSRAVVHILAAETLLRQAGQIVPVGFLAMIYGVLLLAASKLARGRNRRIAYSALVGSLFALMTATAFLGVQAFFAYPMGMFAIYAVLRLTALYRQRHFLIDPITRMPNFTALSHDFENASDRTAVGIVVVKVLRLDAISSDFSTREKRHYLKQIAKRLTVIDEAQKVYFDDGKYFAFLTENLGDAENREHLTGLRAIASQPVEVGGKSIDAAVTIGGDFCFEATVEHRLSSAIAAADQAREAFRPVFLVSGPQEPSDQWDHTLTARLAEALAQDRIKVKLQPQVNLSTGNYVGAEALARWHDEDGGEIQPARFVSQCERMGRLDDLTKRVVERSLSALQMIQRFGHDLPIAINVSAVQLVDYRIVDIVAERLEEYAIDPAKIKLEITETARIEDFSTAGLVMERLRSLGVTFSLDDFGTGSANLEALQRLPFHQLKIDQLFVRNLSHCAMSRAIVEGVLKTAHSASISSVAEGIEDKETHDLLASMGCEIGQGFYIARPQWIEQFTETLDLRESRLFGMINS